MIISARFSFGGRCKKVEKAQKAKTLENGNLSFLFGLVGSTVKNLENVAPFTAEWKIILKQEIGSGKIKAVLTHSILTAKQYFPGF